MKNTRQANFWETYKKYVLHKYGIEILLGNYWGNHSTFNCKKKETLSCPAKMMLIIILILSSANPTMSKRWNNHARHNPGWVNPQVSPLIKKYLLH